MPLAHHLFNAIKEVGLQTDVLRQKSWERRANGFFSFLGKDANIHADFIHAPDHPYDYIWKFIQPPPSIQQEKANR